MHKYLILIVLMVGIVGCSKVNGYEPDTSTIKAQVASQIAFHKPQPANTNKPKPQTTCEECKGTKKVRSGDGLALVPCPCGENCMCSRVSSEKPVSNEPTYQNRMLMFTATWCEPCQRWKNAHTKVLNEYGWILGSNPDAHIQVIDTDQNPEISSRFIIQSLPTFVMVDPQGREITRYVGNGMDAHDTAEFFLSNQQLPRDLYPKAQNVVSKSQTESVPQVEYYQSYSRRAQRRLFRRGCRNGRCN